MNSIVDRILAGLRADWPCWKFWLVWRAVGGPLWCARRKDCSGPPLSFDDPDTLAWEIEQRDQN